MDIVSLLMQLILDERETHVIDRMRVLQLADPAISFSHQVLPLGDMSILYEGKEIYLVERKTLSDLMASIKDGRYEEQSHRFAHSTGLERHHIIYIIEGMFSQLQTPTEKKMVQSAMIRLQSFKGFSVIRTCTVNETCDYLLSLVDKTGREFSKGNPLWSHSGGQNEEPSAYCSVVKKVKRDNITKDNISEIILCQIPGVSAVSAKAVLHKFSTVYVLMTELRKDPQCLNDVNCESKGKIRKLGKNVIQNIVHYLGDTPEV
jgi:ERCC4-type nuclease